LKLTICEFIKLYERKYSILDTYINISFVYEPDGTKYTHEYRTGTNDLSLKILNKYKNLKINDYKFKNLEIVLKLRGDEEYYRYEINV
jgi:hypothetical protein